MHNVDIIVICLVAVFAALTSVSVVNAQQTRRRLIQQRLAQLRRRIADLDDTTIAVQTLTLKPEIAAEIVAEQIDTLRGMMQLDQNSSSLGFSLANANQRLAQLRAPGNHYHLQRVLDSDAAVNRAQYQLGEAGRVIRKRHGSGHVNDEQMQSFIAELAWQNLMVAVVTLIAQGHKTTEAGDYLRAHAFYKKAQQIAMASQVNDERRHDVIRELSEILNGQRQTLSKVLMPETQLTATEIPLAKPVNS